MFIIHNLKEECVDIFKKRNEVIKKLLLDKFDYIISPQDQIVYLDQVSKILVYDVANDFLGPQKQYEDD